MMTSENIVQVYDGDGAKPPERIRFELDEKLLKLFSPTVEQATKRMQELGDAMSVVTTSSVEQLQTLAAMLGCDRELARATLTKVLTDDRDSSR